MRGLQRPLSPLNCVCRALPSVPLPSRPLLKPIFMQYCFISVKEQRHTVQAKIIDHFRQTVFFTVYHIFRRPQQPRIAKNVCADTVYPHRRFGERQHSIVFGAQLKIGLGMLADRTHLRRGASAMGCGRDCGKPRSFPRPVGTQGLPAIFCTRRRYRSSCVFSMFATPSNRNASSSKPSSRAVLANSAYMSLHS